MAVEKASEATQGSATAKGSVARRPFRTRDEIYEQIVQAAGELFASRGFAEPTIREIADAADVALPALYRLFVDKRDIYVQCCKRAAARHQAIMDTITDPTDSDEITLYKMWRFGLALKRDKVIDFRLMQRVINDGEFDLLKEEIEDYRQSNLFDRMLGICGRLSNHKQVQLRLIIMETFFNHIPTALQTWPGYLPLDGDLDALAQDILSIFFPHVDWHAVATDVATPSR